MKDDDHPPELVLVPRRTNEHQQSSNPQRDNPEQMTDIDLSQAIIRTRHQLDSIAPKLPDTGARLKANLKLMEDEQNRRNSIRVQNQNGCPELDTVACGTLIASHLHDFNSTDEDVDDIEVPQSTGPSTSCDSTPFEEVQSNDGLYGVQEATQSDEGVEIVESLKVLAEASKARVEERKRKLEDEQKYSIGECLKIMDQMEPEIADHAYIHLLKVLQEKGWREAFLHMSDKRRRAWISSIRHVSMT